MEQRGVQVVGGGWHIAQDGRSWTISSYRGPVGPEYPHGSTEWSIEGQAHLGFHKEISGLAVTYSTVFWQRIINQVELPMEARATS